MYITLAIAVALGRMGVLSSSGNIAGLLSAVFYFTNYASLLHPGAMTLPTGLGLIWSLMVEEHFYLLFPLLYQSFGRLRLSKHTQGGILVGLCATALLWRCYLVFVARIPLSSFGWTYAASDCRFDAILWGCVLAVTANPKFADSGSWLLRFKGPLAIGGLVLIVLTLLWREQHWRETFRYTVQSMALYPIFYYCISSENHFSVRWLSWKPVRWIGWISYSMYLIHVMVLTMLGPLRFGHALERGLLAFGISLVYAMVMRCLIETPLRQFKQAKAKPNGDRLVSVSA
jgi:peptidoglycan/LPS O-acetylase OafA/YrhL